MKNNWLGVLNMEFNLGNFILRNLEAAGVIGGYVSISIIGVALITYFTQDKLKGSRQLGPNWMHPIFGALLGAIPGCGGTIVTSAMYKNHNISFGGLLAAFITTLGEGSFVLLGASKDSDVASNLEAFAIVNLVGLTTALILGYLVDILGVRSDRAKSSSVDDRLTYRAPGEKMLFGEFIEKYGFYTVLALAIFLAPGSIAALWGGSILAIANLTVWATIALTLLSIVYYVINEFIYKGHDCSYGTDVKSSVLHAVFDITMVVTYVFVGLFLANFIIDELVGPQRFDQWMNSSTFALVLIAALIGVTPGCGGMISVTAAFITVPNFPIAALIAAGIATSGDGIFPLLAENRKDGLLVTGISLVVAVVVGYITLMLGF